MKIEIQRGVPWHAAAVGLVIAARHLFFVRPEPDNQLVTPNWEAPKRTWENTHVQIKREIISRYKGQVFSLRVSSLGERYSLTSLEGGRHVFPTKFLRREITYRCPNRYDPWKIAGERRPT